MTGKRTKLPTESQINYDVGFKPNSEEIKLSKRGTPQNIKRLSYDTNLFDEIRNVFNIFRVKF